MASGRYYSNDNFNQDHSYSSQYGSDQPYRREDAPLPSVPQLSISRPNDPPHPNDISPVNSPFSDHAYPTYPPPGQQNPLMDPNSHANPHSNPYSQPPQYGYGPQSHTGPSGYSYPDSDPFGDRNAIPLQTQGIKPGPTVITSPTSALGEAENGYPPQAERSRGRKHKSRSRRSGIFARPIPFAVYILTLIQIIVFIYELIRNATLTGSPIQIHPTFNPMIGPSPYVLINVGARYVSCMREFDIPSMSLTLASPGIGMPCPNTTTGTVPVTGYCNIADLCGHGMNLTPGADGKIPQPNQWWRFITPIFLHGGIIHIAFNLVLQLTIGRDIEKQIGTVRFLLVYFSAGIFGFVFGGNFAPTAQPSVGCSGALFGIIAIVLLDLLYTWKARPKPMRDFLWIMLEIVVAFLIGLLPWLDNFSHIGGFLMGLALGICILHSPDSLRERIDADKPPYSVAPGDGAASPVMSGAKEANPSHPGLGGDPGMAGSMPTLGPRAVTTGPSETGAFLRRPVGFFKGRKPLWWVWWLVRAGAITGVLIVFIFLVKNFYTGKPNCGWCKYLSCLPIKNWCDAGNLEIQSQSSQSTSSKRAIEAMFQAMKS